jgi:hypothetical protein
MRKNEVGGKAPSRLCKFCGRKKRKEEWANAAEKKGKIRRKTQFYWPIPHNPDWAKK